MSEPADVSHLFPPFPVREDLAVLAKERGWPDGLAQRLVDLRVRDEALESWLADRDVNVTELEQWASRHERLTYGTLRARKADVSDADQFAEVWANSPTDIGDWEVTVERSPNPFAQWSLQEHVVLNVLVDRGLMVACQANSRRNALIGGERFTVSVPQGMRVRKEFRRLDYSQLVTGGGGGPHPNTPVDNAWYMYMRAGNLAAYEWMKALRPGAFGDHPDRGNDVPGIDTWILMYPATPATAAGAGVGIRPARPADLRRCVTLINRIHRGLDLFRPYTVDFLENRLDQGFWAPQPDWWPHVYGWQDFFVVEEAGTVVACGGLWDRGRDIREVWRKKDGSETNVVDATALMDFGYARGKSDAMARLVEHFIGVTESRGRSFLIAPFQFQAGLARLLRDRAPVTEHRRIQWFPHPGAPSVALTRPYTDLAYW